MIIGTVLFLALGVFTLVMVILGLVAWMRDRTKSIVRLAGILGIVYALYAVALVTVSLFSQAKDLKYGEEQCFDDWCATVTQFKIDPISSDSATARQYVVVYLRVTNKGKRMEMAPDSPRVQLIDSLGNAYGISEAGQAAYVKRFGKQEPLDKRIGAGESFNTALVFDLPSIRNGLKVSVTEGGWPSRLVIGDENSFFHAHRTTPLD
ncbi:MAG: hypothetical protein WAU88_03950 [Candidatus Zixiibacteriota bacterium]